MYKKTDRSQLANPVESELTGYDAVELTKTKVTISEYSLAMSSAPAMPFSFQTTSAEEVSGEVAEKAKNANLGEVGAALSNAVQGVAQTTAAGGGVICPNCGATVKKGKKFCPDCGKEVVEKPLIPKCSFCGATLYFGKKYCVDCGKKVEEN